MLIHIISEQAHFIKIIIELFELCDKNNNLYFIYNKQKSKLSLLSNNKPNVIEISYFEGIIKKTKIDGVLVHGLSIHIDNLIRLIPEEVKIGWYVWGYEAYNFWPGLTKNIYLSKTKIIYSYLNPKSFIKQQFIHQFEFYKRKIKSFFERIDFCITQYYYDYELFVKSGLLTNKTKWLWGAVGFIDQILTDTNGFNSINNYGHNILVGNSATYSNNHLEIFEILRKFELGNRKLIVPLNYGNPKYKNYIIKIGNQMFKDNFQPLKDFYPLEEYNKILNSCNCMIMNHNRQQGGSNIRKAIWNGMRIYLNKTSIYKTYKDLGIHLNTIEDDLLVTKIDNNRFSSVSKMEVVNNRKILLENLSKEVVINKTREILQNLRK